MTPDEIQALISRYFAATRAMDVEVWLACFADDAVSFDPYGAAPIEGKEGLRTFFLSVTAAFTAIEFTEDFVSVSGNRAAVKFTLRGVAANGKSATGEGIDLFEINDRGRIQTMWGYWNPAAMMAQLQA